MNILKPDQTSLLKIIRLSPGCSPDMLTLAYDLLESSRNEIPTMSCSHIHSQNIQHTHHKDKDIRWTYTQLYRHITR